MFPSSGVLFSIAKQSYEHAKAIVNYDRSHESKEPLISIIFSAAAGEAFINEVGELALQPTSEPETVQIQNFGRLLAEIENSRGTTNLKYMSGKFALTGEFFTKGSNPYQNFVTLMELRNSIMHLKFDRIKSVKANDVQIERPPIIKRLPKNVLADFGGDKNPVASWLDLISTPAAAKWACNATSGIVKDIVESIPDSILRQQANLFYFQFDTFSPIA